MTDQHPQGADEATARTATPGEEPLVAFGGIDVVSINASTMALAISAASGAQSVIAPDVVAALSLCTRFDTIESHSNTICTALPNLAARRDAVVQTLRQLSDSGILLKADDVDLNDSGASEAEGALRAPVRLFITTADRPAELRRLFDSLLRSSGLSDYQRIFLIDDSRDAEMAEKNREAVAEFNLRCARSVSYVGSDLQKRIIEHLHRALPGDSAATDFLLSRESWGSAATYGRARTFGLLLSVGCRAIFLDDDILCEAYTPAGSSLQLRLGSSSNRDASFFERPESMFASAQRLIESPLQLHSRVLGQPLAALRDAFGDLNLRHSEAALALQLRGNSPLLVTQCGSWGDPGTGDPHWVMNLQADSIAPLVDSETDLRTLLEARTCWFGNRRPTLLKNAFMSQMTGLDNSALLPPYFPAFRGEDQLFGSMVNALHPHSLALDLPWGVPHLPTEQRGSGAMRASVPLSPGLGLAARFIDTLVDYDSEESPEERLAYVTLQLQRVARRSDDNLEIMYRSVMARARAEQLQRIQALRLSTAEFPSRNWLGYLDRALEELERSMQEPTTLAKLSGEAAGGGRDAVAQQLRDSLQGFGDALALWPALREQSAAVLDLFQGDDTP